MPRGVVIPQVRQQLFAALERLIATEGLSGLTGRAVTRAAGVATGLLYTHFRSWEGFLAQYATDRSFQLASGVADLAGRAGTATVAANLDDAVNATPFDVVVPLIRLLASRADLAAEVERVLGPGTAGLAAVEQAVARYLAAEQDRGRLPAATDPGAAALALVGVLHYRVLTGADRSEVDSSIRLLTSAFI
ncbi:TetR/AcrR family transcriptional regulator [Actinoplanes sp. NPDC051470]|uniref:TetR/AcrR family transcriptional regulator n=1 Tax=Actinoplanes sp. NPDC051470 TaxID=3157224 RepID=UPI0034218193